MAPESSALTSNAVAEFTAGDHDHLVQFYDREDELVSTVAAFIGDALRNGDPAIVVATETHRRAFGAALMAEGLDIGNLVMLDAAETLTTFMHERGPDPGAFDATVGGLVRAAAASGRPVRVYGEMVALLWDVGDVAGAIELESLWNDLADDVAFKLLCAYALSTVEGGEFDESLMHVCELHTSVVAPASRTVEVVTDDMRAFSPTVAAVARARGFVREFLETVPRHAALVPDALVVVSELATNAVMHARSGFEVSLSSSAHVLRIVVRDASSTLPVRRTPDRAAEGGRGLTLIAAMAERWGTEITDSGKVVWAELRAGSHAGYSVMSSVTPPDTITAIGTP